MGSIGYHSGCYRIVNIWLMVAINYWSESICVQCVNVGVYLVVHLSCFITWVLSLPLEAALPMAAINKIMDLETHNTLPEHIWTEHPWINTGKASKAVQSTKSMEGVYRHGIQAYISLHQAQHVHRDKIHGAIVLGLLQQSR